MGNYLRSAGVSRIWSYPSLGLVWPLAFRCSCKRLDFAGEGQEPIHPRVTRSPQE